MAAALITAGEEGRGLEYADREVEEALAELEKELSMGEERNVVEVELRAIEALFASGEAHEACGNTDEAIERYEKCMMIARGSGDDRGEVASFERLVSLVWHTESGGADVKRPPTPSELRSMLGWVDANSTSRAPAIQRGVMPSYPNDRLVVKIQCSDAVDVDSLVEAAKGYAPKEATSVRALFAKEGPGVCGRCIEVQIEDEGLTTCDDDAIAKMVPLIVWLKGVAGRAEGRGRLLEWSPGATRDQRRCPPSTPPPLPPPPLLLLPLLPPLPPSYLPTP